MLAEGKQDIFQHIKDVKQLGACQIDPWNAHLAQLRDKDQVIHAGGNPDDAGLSAQDDDYIARVKAAAEEAEMPWGCLAADGAHIYEADEAKMKANRLVAYRWLDIAGVLGCSHMRIDAGGPEEMPDDVFEVIAEGYADVIGYARDRDVRVITENHWGPGRYPRNCVKLVESIDGLGFLFDSNNWAEGHQQEGWELCAKHAEVTHIKTFEYDENGWDPTVDLKKCMKMLIDDGFDGVWGIESCPREVDEMEGGRKTVELIRMAVKEATA